MPTLMPVDKIQAALDSREMQGVRSILRASAVKVDHKFTRKELDEKLRESSLSIAERIALKGAMDRAGLVE